MAALPVVLLAASAATSAIGALSASQAQAASYRSQQNAANYNAAASRQNANAALAAGSANELAVRRENAEKLGEMRAGAAAATGGFSGTTGEALDQAGANLELNALNTRYAGKVQAYGYQTQVPLLEQQAKVAGENANMAVTSGWIGATAGALGSFSNYYNYRGLMTQG